MDGRATKTESTFRMAIEVRTRIRAAPEVIWKLLTTAADFPRWNSTVTELVGPIELGRRLELRVPISDRTFTPRVSVLEAPKRMVWSDGMMPFFRGDRTFTLEPVEDGVTDFTMIEVFRGVMLPMIKGSLPDFAPAFEAYAADLVKAAE